MVIDEPQAQIYLLRISNIWRPCSFLTKAAIPFHQQSTHTQPSHVGKHTMNNDKNTEMVTNTNSQLQWLCVDVGVLMCVYPPYCHSRFKSHHCGAAIHPVPFLYASFAQGLLLWIYPLHGEKKQQFENSAEMAPTKYIAI